MADLAIDYANLTRICECTRALHRVHQIGGDEMIEREVNAVCRAVWGYNLDDFTDDDLSPKDHAWLDSLTRERASDFAAIGKVEGVVAAGVGEGVAGIEHVGGVEIDPGVTVGVRVIDMREKRLPATDFHRLRATAIGIGRQRLGRLGSHLRASQTIGASPAARRTLMFSCATTMAPSLWNSAFPPV